MWRHQYNVGLNLRDARKQLPFLEAENEGRKLLDVLYPRMDGSSLPCSLQILPDFAVSTPKHLLNHQAFAMKAFQTIIFLGILALASFASASVRLRNDSGNLKSQEPNCECPPGCPSDRCDVDGNTCRVSVLVALVSGFNDHSLFSQKCL